MTTLPTHRPLLEVGDHVTHPTRGKGFIVEEIPNHPSIVKVKFGRKIQVCRRDDLTRIGVA